MLLSEVLLPPTKWFMPTSGFLAWFASEARGRAVIDCGAGNCLLGRLGASYGLRVLSVDIIPREGQPKEIMRLPAETFPFSPGMVAFIARPCRGDWIRATIDHAMARRADAVYYVGLQRWNADDLSDLPYDVEEVYRAAGLDNESVWRITRKGEPMGLREPEFSEWLFIRDSGRTSGGCFVGLTGDGNIHWGGGMSYCGFLPDRWQVLAREAVAAGSSKWDQADRLEYEWTRRFNMPVPQDPCASGGWIAPNGDFYPCRYHEHQAAATRIALCLFGSREGQRHLEDAGWVHLYDDGLVALRSLDDSRQKTQQAQLATLRKIADAWETVADTPKGTDSGPRRARKIRESVDVFDGLAAGVGPLVVPPAVRRKRDRTGD